MFCYPDRFKKLKEYYMIAFDTNFLFKALDKLIHSANKKGKLKKHHEKRYNNIDKRATEIMPLGNTNYFNKETT